MRRIYFVAVLFFFLGVVYAASSTELEFKIGGCTFDFKGESFGLAADTCSSGDAYGLFYCDDELNGYVTTEDVYGCSRGSTSTVPDDACCPSGMYCNATTFLCNPRITACSDQVNQADCEDASCLWLDITSECVEGKKDLDCGYYPNSTTCVADVLNLGREGIGSEFCGSSVNCGGTTLSIPEVGCKCEWYPLAGQCQIKIVAQEMWTEIGDDIDEFQCTNEYSLGDCVDGVQSVSWFSNYSIVEGFGDPDSLQECLDALNCNGGEAERFCGEEAIKLSFFSVFSFIISLFLIFLSYYFNKN